MKWLTVAASGLTVVVAVALLWVLYNNRGSEKVVGAVLPILIAAAVAVGIVLAFSRVQPQTQTFPAMFFFRQANAAPIDVPFRSGHVSLFLVSQLVQAKPEVVQQAIEGHTVAHMYHHLLQRSLIDGLTLKYRGSWQMDFIRTNLQGMSMELFQPSDPKRESTIVDSTTLDHALTENMFSAVKRTAPWDQLALPPGSSLTVTAPKQDTFSEGRIEIKNPLTTFTIETRFSMEMAGAGSYIAMAGGDPMDPAMRRAAFIVKMTFTESFWKSGHPDLIPLRQWASQMMDEIRVQFDEERNWTNARDAFLLQRQMPPRQPPPENLGQIAVAP